MISISVSITQQTNSHKLLERALIWIVVLYQFKTKRLSKVFIDYLF